MKYLFRLDKLLNVGRNVAVLEHAAHCLAAVVVHDKGGRQQVGDQPHGAARVDDALFVQLLERRRAPLLSEKERK